MLFAPDAVYEIPLVFLFEIILDFARIAACLPPLAADGTLILFISELLILECLVESFDITLSSDLPVMPTSF